MPDKILLVLIPAGVIISLAYYYALSLHIRIIASVLATTYFVVFLYLNFKDADEFIKVIQFIKDINLFSKKTKEKDNTKSS